MKYTVIEHFSHPHLLLWNSAETVPYQCDGCKELGFKACYRCEYVDCDFHLHEECATASSSTFHTFFKKCDFKFNEKAPGECPRYCDACGKDVLGFVYQCTHKKAYDLHPCCVKLQHTIKGDGIELKLSKKVSSKCLKCQSKEVSKGIKGWSYVSTCGQYCYHVACVKDMVLENWKNGNFVQQSDAIELSSLEMQSMVPSQELVMQCGESSSRRKGSRYWSVAKLVLQLIISAIFGDPTYGVVAFVESLFSN
ncbi:hypothetical protein L1049_010871 [Liquidambar formosana]|uniref:DC1 domain-containing protein n=1 Tax=Liquidambar formosana TaxID=63359 RepID=A0AAP0WXQ8_LIQFO